MTGARQRIRTLGCDVDALTMKQTQDRVLSWVDDLESIRRRLSRDNGSSALSLPSCRFVVTPNLDHAVLLEESPPLRAAYRDAALVVADGMPLVWAARLLGHPLPERVAGSDLTPALLSSAKPGTKVFFLGASEESSQRAVNNARKAYPQIEIVGRLSPPLGFEKSAEWSDKIVTAISQSHATLVLVGFGAPKQELWVHAHAKRLPGTVVLCVGATIDFLAGTVKRAPEWAQRAGIEWIHRLLSDPKRLARRYGKDALHLPGLLLRDVLSQR